MGEFIKPEIDKKDFVSSKLYDDLMSGRYPDIFYKYRANPALDDTYPIEILEYNTGEVIDTYLYKNAKCLTDDVFQLALMTRPLFEHV